MTVITIITNTIIILIIIIITFITLVIEETIIIMTRHNIEVELTQRAHMFRLKHRGVVVFQQRFVVTVIDSQIGRAHV